jgi:hypothetical protein
MNIIGHNTNAQHIDLIVENMKAADKAEGTAVEHHRLVALGISRVLDALGGKGKALRGELKDRLAKLGSSELHNDYAVRLLGREGDSEVAKKSRKAATELRNAYLWMAAQEEQVEWVLANSSARQPTSMHVIWKNHQSAIIKEGIAAGSPPATIAARLLGTSPEAVQKSLAAKAKSTAGAERRAAEAEAKAKLEREAQRSDPTPAPAPDVDPIMAFRDYLLEATERELDAFQTLIDERRNRLKPVAKVVEEETVAPRMKEAAKLSYMKTVGDVASAIDAEVSTFALMKGNSSSKAATVRVSRRFSKVTITIEGDNSPYEFSFKGKSLSVKMLKRFIMDAMMKHGTFPPEGGLEQIGPSTGPINHDAAFRLYLQH